MSPAHKDKHMIGTCPDCPDGLQEEDVSQDTPTLREALDAAAGHFDELAAAALAATKQTLPEWGLPWFIDTAHAAATEARAALDVPERTGYDLTQEINRLIIADVNLLGLLKEALTWAGGEGSAAPWADSARAIIKEAERAAQG